MAETGQLGRYNSTVSSKAWTQADCVLARGRHSTKNRADSGVICLLVRVIDTDSSRDNSAATLSVDQMVFRRTGGAASDTADDENLLLAWIAADLSSFSQIRLTHQEERGNDRASLVDAIMASDSDPF